MSLKISELNHVGLWVESVEESVYFYKNVLGLEQLPRPAFNFDGAWFRLGASQELHILEGRTEPVFSNSRKTHFALKVESIKDVENFLKSADIKFVGPKQRPDGAWQIFITDPDGYWVEFSEINL